jgi:ABC-type multidrug transport system fused ATPase/permease subunit
MSNLQESISGIRVAQSFSRERKNAERFDRVNTENLQANVYAAQIFSLFFPTIEIIGAVGLAIVLFFGGRSVIDGKITLGILILFQSYVIRFFHPIMNLTMFYNSIQSAFAGAERIFELLDTPPDVLEVEGADDIGRTEGRVEFDNVVFGYVEDVKVLDGFDLEVASKERLAIVGPTGAGKSTVMNLLLRFYDVGDGTVRLDGRDIRELSLSSLRGNMAIVLQDTYLFSGTISDNIRFGRPDATDEEVESVAKIVGADGFIRRLPAGYDTVVSERGSNLSVGQRQLISFARALLVDPPILLLDEATSSVDPYTELMIQDALEELLKNRTSIVIAHRLSTVRNSDRIIVIDQGKIVEEGGHEELIEKGGMYKNLCEMQLMAANSR